jgi:hypothetical protein
MIFQFLKNLFENLFENRFVDQQAWSDLDRLHVFLEEVSDISEPLLKLANTPTSTVDEVCDLLADLYETYHSGDEYKYDVAHELISRISIRYGEDPKNDGVKKVLNACFRCVGYPYE